MPRDLAELWKVIQGAGRLLIVTHDNPDPDALASACALSRLVRSRLDMPARICCEGIVGRAENRALARELRLKLYPASRVEWRKWPAVALVDTQPGTGNNSLPPRVAPEVVIDHHPPLRNVRAKFVDVRPAYGATTTILGEYLLAESVDAPPGLAAAICYAIASETQDLAREAGEADAEVYVRFYLAADKRALGRILHPRLKHSYFSTLTRAVLSAFTYGNIIGSHLGEIPYPDFVSLVADLLLAHERMGWSIVTGVHRGQFHVSLRARSPRARAGALLRRILRPWGRAGGHDTMAGGSIPLSGAGREARETLQEEVVSRLIRTLKRRTDFSLKPLIPDEELTSVCKIARRDL